MYENKTEENIRQKLFASLPDTVSKIEGTLIYEIMNSFSLELAQAYVQLERVLKLGFAKTSTGEYLKMKAAEHNVNWKEPQKSRGEITFKGVPQTVINSGKYMTSDSGKQFKTINDCIISESGEVITEIESLETGNSYNVPAGSITTLTSIISGVDSVINIEETSGGTDGESEEALYKRLEEKVQKPAASGNERHYIEWAKEVPGVYSAQVQPLWNGNGSLKIFLMDNNKEPAGKEIIDKVADYIEEKRPVGAVVTVVKGNRVDINISANIIEEEGYTLEMIKENIKNNIIDYLKDISYEQDYVSFGKIASSIATTTGVKDYTGLKVNTGTDYIQLNTGDIPILNSLNLVSKVD